MYSTDRPRDTYIVYSHFSIDLQIIASDRHQ